MSSIYRAFLLTMLCIGMVEIGVCNDEIGPAQNSIDATFASWTEMSERADLLEAQFATLSQQINETKVKGSAADCSCNLVCPGWQVDVDYLNWRLEQRGSDYAMSTDLAANTIGNGDVQHLRMPWDAGARARLAYRCESGWQIAAGYTYFSTEGSDSVAAPAGGNLWATLSHPNDNEEALTASAFGEFDLNMFDLEMRYPIIHNDALALELFSGLRGVDIEQNRVVDYDGNDFTNAQVSNTLEMTGFGARLGGEIHWTVGDRFSLFGRAAGSVLYGRFHTQLLETDRAGIDTIVNVGDAYGRPVTVAETAVGAAWRVNDMLNIRAGYELADWFGIGNRAMFPDNTHEGSYVPLSDDVLLHGFFVRLTATR